MAMKVTKSSSSINPTAAAVKRKNKKAVSPKKSKVKSGSSSKNASKHKKYHPSLTQVAKTSKSALTQRLTALSNGSQPVQVVVGGSGEPSSAATSTIPPTTTATSTTTRAIWYLGGNQLAQLLASVEGDLDPVTLSQICEVPSVVGDLALSVESLVSDDLTTIGGFETKLLAQITSNTLLAKQQEQQQQQQQAVVMETTTATQSPLSSPIRSNTTTTTSTTQVMSPLSSSEEVVPKTKTNHSEEDNISSSSSTSSPNYDPVPNPLARITPPASPRVLRLHDDHDEEEESS